MMKRILVRFGTGVLAGATILISLVYAPRPLQSQEVRTAVLQRFAAGPDRLTFLTEFLTLTASQQEQSKAILDEEESAVNPVMEQMKDASDELAAAAKNPDGDIDSAAAQIGSLSGQIIALDAKAAARLYQLLTSAQKHKFDQLPPPLLVTPSLLGPGPGIAVSGHFETAPGPAR